MRGSNHIETAPLGSVIYPERDKFGVVSRSAKAEIQNGEVFLFHDPWNISTKFDRRRPSGVVALGF